MIKELVNHIRQSFQKRIFLINILLFVVPFLLVACVIVYIAIAESNKQVNRSRIALMRQTDEKLERMFQEITYLSDSVYWNKEVNEILSKRQVSTDYEHLKDQDTIDNLFLNNRYVFNQNPYEITILCTNGSSYSSLESINQSPDSLPIRKLMDEPWYQDFSGDTNRILYIPYYESEKLTSREPDAAVFAVRQMKNLNSGRFIGLMIISIKEDFFSGLYQGETDFDAEGFLIINMDGAMISQTNTSLKGCGIQNLEHYSRLMNSDSGYFLSELDEKKQQFVFVTNERTGWKLVSYRSLESLIKNWSSLFTVITLTAVIYFFIILYMSYVTSKIASRPVRKLLHDMKMVQEGDLTFRSVVNDDEFGQLYSQFNSMMAQIEGLLTALEEEGEKKRVMEIQALQTQINPHFLYNTLASIRFMLDMDMPERAEEALILLSKLLKRTFSDYRKVVPLKEEIETINQYLCLLKLRHEDAFVWEFRIEEDCMELPVLKFILQPLIENSVSHGFNQKNGVGHITISGWKWDNDIILTVEDDGVGVDPKRIQDILNGDSNIHSSRKFNSIGIKNVDERLKLMFGVNYGLSISPLKEGGTAARVSMPVMQDTP